MDPNIIIKHTLIDASYIQKLVVDCNISPIVQCDFLARGLNDTYIITTENDIYIFRLYRHGWRNKSAILFELNAITQLHEKGASVSFPFRNNDADYLFEIEAPEGLRYGVLFSYAKGERPQINEENSKSIGAALGKLHKQSSSFHLNYERGFDIDINHLLDEPVSYISPLINTYLGSEADQSMKDIVEEVKTELSTKELEIGFCHGDFHNHNMHIHNGELEIFDFDCSAVGYRAYDVAVSWWNLKNNYSSKEKECWDAFLTGYQAQRSLTEDDLQSLPLFITARRIWLLGTMTQNDDVWGTNWVNERTLEFFILQLKTDRLKER
ncbi:phosphotransferase enzyme family protein [Virgibacillus byunsanensis]|uniref:Phosphotransferase enzyme family protein n=1 Tax=Virgibacillus byunsanensis TaxID=570945 RepID=A0ABW3LPQ7_9BACI